MAQLVKNLPVMRETWVQCLGWEDSLEEGMSTHSSVLTWKKRGAWRAVVPQVIKSLFFERKNEGEQRTVLGEEAVGHIYMLKAVLCVSR